jgi:hypothetical protein
MPKLSLRDLFAVVTIVALALGWWVDRSRLARENKRLRFAEMQLRPRYVRRFGAESLPPPAILFDQPSHSK